MPSPFSITQLRELKTRMSEAVAETLDELGAETHEGGTHVCAQFDDLVSYLTTAVYDEILAAIEDEPADDEVDDLDDEVPF